MLRQASNSLEGRSVRRSLAWDGLRAFEAVYEPHTALSRHEHSAPFFTYVLRGEYLERTSRTDRDCRRGSVIFHPPGDAHANAVGPRGTKSLNVEIAPELWSELADEGLAGRVLSGDVEWLAASVWREFHRDDTATRLGMDEAVALLCASVRVDKRSAGSISARRLATSAEYIGEHLTAAPPPSLAEVAHVACVHPMHLARLFRQRFGYSMGEFVRRAAHRLGLRSACRLRRHDLRHRPRRRLRRPRPLHPHVSARHGQHALGF